MVDAGLGNPERTSTESLDRPQDHEHHQQVEQQQPSESLQEAIDIVPSEPEPQWIVSILEEYALARKKFPERPCSGEKWSIIINRVPRSLKDGADQRNIPQVVSLGPYHHDNESLREMEQHKWQVLHRILERHHQDIKTYLNAMKELEQKARDCYEPPVPTLKSEQFVQMMVLDGCFMLELFGLVSRFNVGDQSSADKDLLKSIGYSMIFSIRRDMIKVENQIPLFVLEELLSLQMGKKESDQSHDKKESDQSDKSDRNKSVAQLALEFFNGIMPVDPLSDESGLHCLDIFRRILPKEVQPAESPTEPTADDPPLHCLDILRRSLVSKGSVQPSDESGLNCLDILRRILPKEVQRVPHRLRYCLNIFPSMKGILVQPLPRHLQRIHCVIDLKNAGVEFKKWKTDRFWDIKFDKRNGVLKIPRIIVTGDTLSLLFNLLAFEQCQMNNMDGIITSYVIFMSYLINSAEDVSHLHHCGIIEHLLGTDAEAADSFNKLCHGVGFNMYDSHLSQVYKEVNTYFKHKRNAWKADLRNKYFKNPWAIISLVAAVILLLLTFAQSFYAVYAYYRPPKS